jgi:hypothetical protein
MLCHLGAHIEIGGKAGVASKRTASVRLTDSALPMEPFVPGVVMPNT